MPAVWPDVSYFQRTIDMSYARDAVAFRFADGDFLDPNRWANAAACNALVARGSLRLTIVYVVFEPASTAVQEARAAAVAAFCRSIAGTVVVMLDVESWGGKIRGNQSGPLNDLYARLVAKLGGNPRLVWGYANAGDWAGLWPQRPAFMPTVLASYTDQRRTMPGGIGQQYTDGETRWGVPPGLPVASAPFGACDHNVAWDHPDAASIVATIGGATGAVVEDQEDDMLAIAVSPDGRVWVGNGVHREYIATPARLAATRWLIGTGVFKGSTDIKKFDDIAPLGADISGSTSAELADLNAKVAALAAGKVAA